MPGFNNHHSDFPGLAGIHEMENQVKAHELKELYLNLGHGAPITATSFFGAFEDDHLPCANVSVVVNGKEHKFCILWEATQQHIFHFGRAAFDKHAHQIIRDYLIDQLEDSAYLVGQEE